VNLTRLDRPDAHQIEGRELRLERPRSPETLESHAQCHCSPPTELHRPPSTPREPSNSQINHSARYTKFVTYTPQQRHHTPTTLQLIHHITTMSGLPTLNQASQHFSQPFSPTAYKCALPMLPLARLHGPSSTSPSSTTAYTY
jgi:hypothetical protein